MRITFSDTLAAKWERVKGRQWSAADLLPILGLPVILLLAAVLRLINLSALGYINHYYAAAVVSMLQSWHNFFFVAADPGGLVSIDKPPLGLWVQTLSASILGVNTLGLLLPEILSGLISIVVVYHLVRRSFGAAAGLLAGLALAVTPVVIATDRNNTMDSQLILVLLLAAWAFIKAAETSRMRFLLLGGALVGIGFNIKMLEAFLPVPAFFALYFLGAKDGIWRKLSKLVLASLLMLVISFSWVTIVDLTPASQRPYVGSSGDNSEMSLVFGYNGLQRLFGMGRTSLTQSGNPFGGGGFAPGGGQPGSRPNGRAPFAGRPNPGQGLPGGFGGAQDGTGQPGLLRLVTAPLSKEVSWLLPVALFGLALLLFRERPRWPLGPKYRAAALWGTWLLTDAVFFSVAGFFHEYYLAMMAGPLVALAAIGAIELWRLRLQQPWLAVILLLAVTGVTLKLQISTALSFLPDLWWQPVVTALLVGGGAILILAIARRMRRSAAAGFSLVMAAVLITPGIWSGLTALHPSTNQSLPAAYDGSSTGVVSGGGLQVDQALLDYLEPLTKNTTYLMAVPSSMQGSDYVIATGRPVLYLGGFMGIDNVVSSSQLASMVADHVLRFIYWDSRGNGFGGRLTNETDLSSWITTHCTAVSGFNTATQNSGAPGGTGAASSNGGAFRAGGFGGMEITLYDCGG
jgi:4-amino-4-deoxy-L-arabinose transferase-like glycosyltransferase